MSRARLGVDSFSYHRWFGETNQWEQPLGVRWSTGQLLEHVASIGVEVLSLQTIHLDDRNPANLSRFGTELAAAGVECILAWGHRSGLEDGQSEEKLNDALHAMDAALALGCRMMPRRLRRPVLLVVRPHRPYRAASAATGTADLHRQSGRTRRPRGRSRKPRRRDRGRNCSTGRFD